MPRGKKWESDEKRKEVKRQYEKQYAAKKLAEIKKIIYEAYGGKCACCGESNWAFLTIDHINNDGYLEKINGKRPGGIYWMKKIIERGFPDTLQLLCANCNLGKLRNNGVCPHNV